MDFYVISLAAGATGLAAMAVVGLSHTGHAGHTGHTHAAGGARGGHHAHAGHAGHGSDAHAHGGHGSRAADQGASWMQSLLSPRVLFALLVGFGAGGLLAEPLGEPWRLGAAILGAAAFEALLVGPIWRFLFRFESNPAATLESAIEDDARAVTGFDANGNGLVAVDVDGQIVQLLATLVPDDRARGVRIRSGDVVRIADVDAARGRCTVRVNDR
jgi:translation initiation factor IF-1